MKAKKYFYHMFPPFIDAYEQSFEEPLTLVEIKKMMELNASYWVNESIKTKGLDSHPIAGENYKQVIYCARIYEAPNKITEKNKLDFVFKPGTDIILLSEVEKVDKTFFENNETLEFLEGATLIEKSWDVT
jgi:hypothetical protein